MTTPILDLMSNGNAYSDYSKTLGIAPTGVTQNAPVSTQSPAQGYKISLTVGNNVVIFEASSPLDESRTAHYEGMNIMHLPTDIQSYKNTSSRTFSITAKLVSRNSSEASSNSRNIDFIRSWVLPGFGGNGATPPIVLLSAFRNRNINKIPCIIESYSIHYPDDVDWIFDGKDPMPVIGSISVTLKEAWTPAQITAASTETWKIKISPAGKFMTGSDYNDNTSAASGDVTPPLIDLSNSGNSFNGLAASPYIPTAPVGTGSTNSCMNYGIDQSNYMTDSNPQTSGYTPESASLLVSNNFANQTNQANAQTNLMFGTTSFGRNGFSVNTPTTP